MAVLLTGSDSTSMRKGSINPIMEDPHSEHTVHQGGTVFVPGRLVKHVENLFGTFSHFQIVTYA